MSVGNRAHWDRNVDHVIRSLHYTRLGEGLAGERPYAALTEMLADIQHICVRQGIGWDTLVAHSQAQFEREEAQAAEHPMART